MSKFYNEQYNLAAAKSSLNSLDTTGEVREVEKEKLGKSLIVLIFILRAATSQLLMQ